jgi:enoyl-[acyl-carrier-protein] reductase (NADH)
LRPTGSRWRRLRGAPQSAAVAGFSAPAPSEIASDAYFIAAKAKAKAPARSLVSIDDVGLATAFLAHDAAKLITGETLYVDGGYHIID